MTIGNITSNSIQINNIQFKRYQNSNKYYLELLLFDSKYDEIQHAVGGPTQGSSSSSSFKAQAPGQLPPYVIRILKKTTPDVNTVTTNKNTIESLWQSVSSFNDQTYIGPDGITTYNATGFGVGLVPFYYKYNQAPWSNTNRLVTNYTYGNTNGFIKIRLDANGGVVLATNSNETSFTVTPNKQVSFNPSNSNIPIMKPCNTYNPVLNGFTEPGCYMVIIMRNSIDNIPDTTVSNNNLWQVDLDNINTKPNLKSAFAIITPPQFNLTYNPSDDLLTFNVKAYGSNNISNNVWTITNQYAGIPNFSTLRYPYNISTVSISKPQGAYPLENNIFSTPSSRYDAFDNFDWYVKLYNTQIVEKSYIDFAIKGAFMYDFRLTNNTTSLFNPYSTNTPTANSGYINYNINVTNNQIFTPSFEEVWIEKLQYERIQYNDIGNNSLTYLNPIIYSNDYIVKASITLPIELNTTIERIGPNHKYVFRSEWTDLFPELLTKESLGSEYILRLYKQRKDISGNSYELYQPVSNYKYITNSTSGRFIYPAEDSLSGYWYNDQKNNKIIVYTGKNETFNIFNTQPTDSNLTNGDYFNETEIRGGWFMVLQRNFTKSEFHTDGKNHVTTQGCFVHHVESPTLSIEYESTNKFPIEIKTTPTNEFINAKNYWSQKGTGIYTIDDNEVIELPQNYIEYPDLSIKQVREIYTDYNNHNLLNRVVIDFGIGDQTFVETLGSGAGALDISVNKFNGSYGNGNITGTNIYDSSSTLVDINTKPIIDPIILDVIIIKKNDEYAFECSWTEPYSKFITNKVFGSEYVLRLYQRNKHSELNDNSSYFSNPINNYKFIDVPNSGLKINSKLQWFDNDTHSMKIIVDKSGNVYDLNYDSNITGGTIQSLNGNGWTKEEIFGGWIMVLQRNFTFADSLDVYNINTQGCFVSNFELVPELLVIKDINNLPSNFETTITGDYKNSINNWSTINITDNTVTTLDTDLIDNPNPSISDLQVILLVSLNPIKLFNHVELILNLGDGVSIFTEYLNLGNKGFQSIISNINKISIDYKYDISTNAITIYERVQSTDQNDYLTNMSCNYVINNNNVYFKILFNEPMSDDLLQNEAYIINIFKKIKGYGTKETQWIEESSKLENYKWNSFEAPGKILNNTNGSIISSGSSLVELIIDVTGNYRQKSLISELTNSFETGGYIIIIRRNFKKPVDNYGVGINCFTLNSQYIYVPPSQPALGLNILNSSNLELTFDSTNEVYSSTIPVYNSYKPDGSFDVDIDLYIKTNEVEKSAAYKLKNIGRLTKITDVNNINIQLDKIQFDISKSELIKYFPDYGPVDFFIDVSYNWTSPDTFDLPIGKIGGFFNGINPPVIDNSLVSPLGTIVLPNKAITNTNELLLPVNTEWNSKNRVSNVKCDFIGDNTNRMLAIKWDEYNQQDLCANFTGSEYVIRIYKKRAEGNTPNDQWYDPINYNGIDNYRKTVDQTKSIRDDGVIQGLPVRANFYEQTITTTYMYFFADSAGNIFYNDYPTNEALITPFTDTDIDGGYLLVIQRNYANSDGKYLFTTTGKYFAYISSSVNTHSLTIDACNNSIVKSEPEPFSSYNSTSNGGGQNLQYTWTVELPTIEYFNVVTGENSNTIDTTQFVKKYRNRDKKAILTSKVKYNFSVDTLPFLEEYPLSSIEGTGFYEVSSSPYTVDLCIRPDSYPPPPWARYTPECPDPNMTPEEREKLQMRRKAETLKHVNNQHQFSATKTQQYAFVAKGYNQRRQTYATQTDSYTNPNTKNYPVLNGRSMTLPTDCPPKVLTFPSTCSDVPGPIVPLTYDPSVPLLNYKPVRTYVNGLTENFLYKK